MHDLQYYISASRLPSMRVMPKLPPEGHKSHRNILQVVPEPWRRLETMYTLSDSTLGNNVKQWTERRIPSRFIDLSLTAPQEQLTVPCTLLIEEEAELNNLKPETTDDILAWIQSPLKTVQCVLHAAFSQTRDYQFKLVEDDPNHPDSALFKAVSWSRLGEDTASTRLVVAVQPPWILSTKDIEMFSKCKSFPPYKKIGDAYPLRRTFESQYRLWGKVFDLCVQQQTRWFVLTSYDKWVFGAFSSGWTYGYVTEVFNYDVCGPTIVEYLTYWVASAMRMPDAAVLPKKFEPVAHRLAPLRIPEQGTPVNYSEETDSESHWTGQSDSDGAYSAGVVCSELGTSFSDEEEGPPAGTTPYDAVLRATMVDDWTKGLQGPLKYKRVRLAPHPWPLPAITSEKLEEDEVRQLPVDTLMGDWMI